MPTSGKEDEFRIGFLAAIEVPDRGYVGGLLVTNRFGRPLEFQCTTPVKPNRTQEILYGPTLIPFVLGELIGRTLVEKIGVKPHLVLTEVPEILEVRNHVSLPVACLDDIGEAAAINGDAPAEPSGNDCDADVEQDSTIIEAAEPVDEPASPPQVVEAANRHDEPQDQPCASTESGCENREAFSPPPIESTTVVATGNGAPVDEVADQPAVAAAAEPDTSTAVCEPDGSHDANGSNGHDPGVHCAAFSQFSSIHSTCTALSIIRIDSDNLSRAIAEAPNMEQARVSCEPHEQIAELKEPAAFDQPEPAPEPAPLQQKVRVELPLLPATKREQPPTKSCVIGRQRLRFHAAHQTDREIVEKRVASLPSEVDLREPFERIREALEETIRSGSVR